MMLCPGCQKKMDEFDTIELGSIERFFCCKCKIIVSIQEFDDSDEICQGEE